MHHRRIRTKLQFRLGRHVIVVRVLPVPGNAGLTLALAFLHRVLAPRTGQNIVGGLARAAHDVHRDHRELQPRTTLQEQDAIVVRDLQQRLQPGLGILQDRLERFAAMADLQYRNATARERQHFALGLLEHRQRQHGWSRREVVHPTDRSVRPSLFTTSEQSVRTGYLGAAKQQVTAWSARPRQCHR